MKEGKVVIIVLLVGTLVLSVARYLLTQQALDFATEQVVQVVDGRGDTVAFAEPAQHVVSLAPSCTEIICAIGGIDRLIGVTRYCDDPAEVPQRVARGQIMEVAGFDSPSREQLLQLAPDVILVSDITSETTVTQLRQSGLKPFVLRGNSLEVIAEDLRRVGEILDRSEEAGVVAAKFEASVRDISQAVAERNAPTVLLCFGILATYSAGEDTFANAVIEAAGGRNVATAARQPWPELSLEYLMAADPEVLLVTTDTEALIEPASEAVLAQYRARPVWRDLSAVREGRVYRINSDLFTVPSPAIVDGIAALAKTLHPDAFPSDAVTP